MWYNEQYSNIRRIVARNGPEGSMDDRNENLREELKSLLAEIGGVDSFTTAQAMTVMQKLAEIFASMGLSEGEPGNFLTVYREIFHLEFFNLPDFNAGKYILTPNHVSEFDGPLFGVLHPNMLVMAKKEWTDDPRLNASLGRYFKSVGVDRKDRMSGAVGIKKCIKHIRNYENSAATIFVQQTIADINNIEPGDIASGAFLVHIGTGAAVLPVFCEQVSLDYPTRIVFGDPMDTAGPKQFGEDWLEAELRMQKSLADPPARKPVLNEKHSIPISQRAY